MSTRETRPDTAPGYLPRIQLIKVKSVAIPGASIRGIVRIEQRSKVLQGWKMAILASIAQDSNRRHVPYTVLKALATGWAQDKTVFPGHPIIWPDLDEGKYICQQLEFERLNKVFRWLWLAGRPFNIHSLHRQKMMQREILITDQADLHLVWLGSIIYIKPLPLFLLDHAFFHERLCSDGGERVPPEIYNAACGFLLSYVRLIACEADFRIAIELGLVPSGERMTWGNWSAFASEVCSQIPELSLEDRFCYGELRLSRLNWIYRLQYMRFRGFHFGYKRYQTFFDTNFGWLLVVFIYVTVVLTAMQVVLASPNFVTKQFQQASYGFGIFCLVTVATAIAVMSVIFTFLFLSNFAVTISNERKQRQNRLRFRRERTS